MTEARRGKDADRIGNVLSSTMSIELDNEIDQGVLENVLRGRVQVPELLELPGPDQRVREVEAVDNTLNPIHLGVCSICRARPGRKVRAGRTVVDGRIQFDGDSAPGSRADRPTRLPDGLSERALTDCGVLSGSAPALVQLAQIHQCGEVLAPVGEFCSREECLTAAPLKARLSVLIAVPAQIFDPRKAKLKAPTVWHRHTNMMTSGDWGVIHSYAIVPSVFKGQY